MRVYKSSCMFMNAYIPLNIAMRVYFCNSMHVCNSDNVKVHKCASASELSYIYARVSANVYNRKNARICALVYTCM